MVEEGEYLGCGGGGWVIQALVEGGGNLGCGRGGGGGNLGCDKDRGVVRAVAHRSGSGR